MQGSHGRHDLHERSDNGRADPYDGNPCSYDGNSRAHDCNTRPHDGCPCFNGYYACAYDYDYDSLIHDSGTNDGPGFDKHPHRHLSEWQQPGQR